MTASATRLPALVGVVLALGFLAGCSSATGSSMSPSQAAADGLPTSTAGVGDNGSVSCLVQPDSDVANDTVTYTGAPPFTKISAADGAVYAAKLGKVCTDVFATAG